MHAELANSATSVYPAVGGRARSELARVVAPALTALLLVVAGVILARRLAGALERPLPPAALLGTGLLLVLLGVAARLVPPAHRWQTRRRRALYWLPTAAVLLAGIALTPGTPPGWIAAFWCVLIGGEALGQVTNRLVQRRFPPPAAVPAGRTRRVEPAQPPATDTAAHVAIPPAEVPADDITQQLTRSVAAGGLDVLTGWLRAGFAPGQRTASVHVAFCPPFAKTPRLAVEQLDGPSARIKTAQLLPYGTRLDLKLTHPATDASDVLLRFRAHSDG